MIINIFLLLLVLSLESAVGVPIFFLYLSYKLISRRSDKFILFALFLTAFLLAIFYSLSWPILIFMLLLFHISYQKLSGKPFIQFFLFLLLNLLIFKIANLQLNYFYLLHLPVFLIYFYKANFKNYAA